jgi:hypothetical protein
MRRRQLVSVTLIVTIGAVCGAVACWRSPRRDALARLAALDGTYMEQRDEAVNANRDLVIIVLSHRQVSEEDLAALRGIRPMHRLFLDSTNVRDDWLAHVAAIEELEWLSICDTQISDEGLVHLRGHPNLRALHMRNSGVGDAGLVPLHGLPKLELINVQQSRVTARGVKELKNKTPSLQQVYRVMRDVD